jgi:transposase
MARTALRRKIPDLEEALTGRFDEHHQFLLSRMLSRIDQIDADIAAVDEQIEAHLAPFADAADRLIEIPGIKAVQAAAIIAETGVDMTRFPTAGHLASWARFTPGVNASAGKQKGNGSTGHGNRYLARALGDAAASAGRTHSFLGARYQRLARRRGKKKALVAVGRSILVIIWHVLRDPDAHYRDLGIDHHDRYVNTAALTRGHVRQLEALGYKVTLQPAA